MADVLVSKGELTVNLSFLKSLGSLSRSFVVPLDCLVNATIVDKITYDLVGLRMGGTGIPGLIALGRFWKSKQWIFCDWKRGERAVVIELKNFTYTRLVLGTNNPEELVKSLGVKAGV